MVEKIPLTPDLLVLLADMYYTWVTPNAIKRVYGNIPAAVTELVNLGLVAIVDTLGLGNCGAKLTSTGKEQLLLREPSSIIEALLDLKVYMPVELFVTMLPIEQLSTFITSEVAFIRQAAVKRFKKLADDRRGVENCIHGLICRKS